MSTGEAGPFPVISQETREDGVHATFRVPEAVAARVLGKVELHSAGPDYHGLGEVLSVEEISPAAGRTVRDLVGDAALDQCDEPDDAEADQIIASLGSPAPSVPLTVDRDALFAHLDGLVAAADQLVKRTATPVRPLDAQRAAQVRRIPTPGYVPLPSTLGGLPEDAPERQRYVPNRRDRRRRRG